MSIPLVQEATKDAINTSIIAIKRNIERINMLLGLVDSGSPDLSGLATKQELEDAITQVETDLAPVDEVTSGNMQSVSSNAVAEKLDNYVCTDHIMPLSKIDLTQFHAVAYLPQNIVLELKNMAGKHLDLEFGIYEYLNDFLVQVSWGSLPAVVHQSTGIGRTSYISISNNDTPYAIMTGMKIYTVSIDIPADCDFVGISSNYNIFFYNLRIS
jgi:hypothetical protein